MRAKELAGALVVAILMDVALWHGDHAEVGGFALAFFFSTVPIVAFFVAHKWRRSTRLIVLSVLLAAIATRSAALPNFTTTACGLLLLFAFAIAIRSPRLFLVETSLSAFSTIGRLPARIKSAYAGVRRLTANTRLRGVSVLPIVVPIGLALVFVGVFALANPIVARGLDAVMNAVASIGLPPVARVFTWALFGLGALGLLRPAFWRLRTPTANVTKEAKPTSLLVARNTFVLLNVVFLAYNALDAAYLWSGRPPAGLTTQQYSHEGAFWLAIALALLTVIVSVMFHGPLAHDSHTALARKLAFVWIGQGFVLSLGTYRRIAIHIAYSGLSDLRIVGILGITLVVVGMGLVALKVRRQRSFRWLVRWQLDAFALTAVLYAVAPTHWISAKVNVARITSGEYRPVVHMFRQSQNAESAATLLPLLHHEDHRIREGVAALLQEERTDLRVESQTGWRQGNLVTGRTLAALDAAGPLLDKTTAGINRYAASSVLFEISRVANNGGSLEEIRAIPDAEHWIGVGTTR
ncbi:MAG: DUF4173 domain-containing protein [Polyangiaceae bacterium]|nr:DUF4173 domain-containing protein [Polyangiaceae bacterium]